jgi:penicillin-binding protein 2
MTRLTNQSTEPYATSFLVTVFLLVAAFGILLFKLAYIQIWKGEDFRILSETNRIRLVEIVPPRGKILDTRRRTLADTRPSFDVTVIPEEIPDSTLLVEQLEGLSPLPVDLLRDRIQSMKSATPYRSFTLWKDATWETIAYLEANRLRIPGVLLQVNQIRDYLCGDLLAHLIGYVSEINQQELSSDRNQGYRMGDRIGKVGIEASWEQELRGVKGGRQIEVDARGRQIRILDRQDPVSGKTLVLCLDQKIQEAARAAFGEQQGVAVAADPRTGSMLCYVTIPTYDPNHFVGGILASEWKALSTDPGHPLNNRGVQGLYPPGSVFKIVMSVAGFEEGLINPSQRVFCTGSYQLGSHTFHCWRKHGHGSVDFHRALVESCDVYFYQLGQRLGIQRIHDYATRLGLGRKTGIQIGGEMEGLIPSPAWKKKRFKAPWFEGETLSVSIGQGAIQVTPVQLLTMVCAVANGGKVWKPRLVQDVEYPDGRPYQQYPPQLLEETRIDPKALAEIHAALRDVVEAPNGTGKRARLPNVEVAGKTGTAQVVGLDVPSSGGGHKSKERKDHAWFVCYAPAGEPEIAVVVLVEHGGHGGEVAAPIARQILEAYFQGRNETPADPDLRVSRR